MEKIGTGDKTQMSRLLCRIEENLPFGQVAEWDDELNSLPPATAAVLVHALHGWINTTQRIGYKSVPYQEYGLIDPEFWHRPRYDPTVLALLNRGFLTSSGNGMSLGLTLKGAWCALQPTEYLAEILEEHHPEEVEQAVNFLLQAHNMNRL